MKKLIFFICLQSILSFHLAYGYGEAHKVEGIGFGAHTTGGTGGIIYEVTSLLDNGSGTLRNFIENSPRPSIIKFSVCGTIELSKRLVITKGDLTIDGSDCNNGYGIQVKNYPVTLQNTNNVILTNIAFRLGTDADMTPGQFSSSDPIEIQCSQNVILNHLSIYWGTDENLSIYCYKENGGSPSNKISLQHSIIAEGLREPSILSPNRHSMGVLVDGKVKNVTFYGNLFVSNADRNPRIATEGFDSDEAGISQVQFINNMIYQTIYGLKTGSKTHSNWKIQVDVIGNYLKKTNNRFRIDVSQKALFTQQDNSKQHVSAYISDNIGINRLKSTDPENNIFEYENNQFGNESVNAANKNAHFKIRNSPHTNISTIPVIPAKHLEQFILNNAGKILPYRDKIDQKLIENVRLDLFPNQGGQKAVDEASDYLINNWQCLDPKISTG